MSAGALYTSTTRPSERTPDRPHYQIVDTGSKCTSLRKKLHNRRAGGAKTGYVVPRGIHLQLDGIDNAACFSLLNFADDRVLSILGDDAALVQHVELFGGIAASIQEDRCREESRRVIGQ